MYQKWSSFSDSIRCLRHGLQGREIHIHHLDLTLDLRSFPNERWLVLFILPAKDIVYLIFIRVVDVQAFSIISTKVQQKKCTSHHLKRINKNIKRKNTCLNTIFRCPLFSKKNTSLFFGVFCRKILRITAVYRSFRVAKVDARWGAWVLPKDAAYSLGLGTWGYLGTFLSTSNHSLNDI